MLKVDLSNVWGDLSLPDLLATEQEVFAAHKTLAEGRGPALHNGAMVQKRHTAAQPVGLLHVVGG